MSMNRKKYPVFISNVNFIIQLTFHLLKNRQRDRGKAVWNEGTWERNWEILKWKTSICIIVCRLPWWLKACFMLLFHYISPGENPLKSKRETKQKITQNLKNEKTTKAQNVTWQRKKNQFPQRKNIKIIYSVTKIYLALHENLFFASPKTSFNIVMGNICQRHTPSTNHKNLSEYYSFGLVFFFSVRLVVLLVGCLQHFYLKLKQK